ncbi:MAG: TonB-dependent receptor [Bryobacterales bacterium]|nr:TonB-dependent receptor [Bryobacterales bacterium]
MKDYTAACRGMLALWAPLLALGSTPQPTAGVQSLKRLSLEELSQLEVTSPAKTPVEVRRVPMAIFVITSEDIRRSGVASIPEALRLAPGVEVARIEGSKWSVGIRGFGSRLSRSVLVLMDGRTVYTTFFAGTYWEVQDTVLEDIDRIEVIRGPGGTVWGPNAVNGVINIITKRAAETQGSFATISAGNVWNGILQYRYGGKAGDRLHYRVYGKGFSRGPQHHSDGRRFDDWRGAQTGFRLDWDRTDTSKLTFQGDLYKQEAGQRVNLVSYTQPFTQFVEADADLSGGNLNLRWSQTLRRGAVLQLQSFYDRTNRLEPNFGERRDTVDLDFVVRESPWRRRHVVSWGAGIRASNGRALEVTSGLTFDPISRTDHLLTGFLQDEISLVPDRLSLTAGTKILRTNFEPFAIEPSARLLWTPNASQTVWAAVTRAVRTPSRVEHDFFLSGYIGSGPGGLPFFGRFDANRDFKSERMNGYEAGARQLLRRNLFVDVAFFHNRYTDLFSQDITGSAFVEQTPLSTHLLLPLRFGNGLEGAATGGEIAPEWRPREYWQLRGSYSYLALDLRRGPGSLDIGTAPFTEGSSPAHRVIAQSLLQLGKNFELDATARYVSALALRGVDSYTTVDARFGWRPTASVDISLVGRNLLQPHHVEFPADPGPNIGIRRALFVRLTLVR